MNYAFNENIAQNIRSEIKKNKSEIIEIRRYLHMHPEIGFDTKNTERLVREKLKKEDIKILPSKMGVVGLIKGKDSSKMIALRADMDALCLQEENDVPYKSQNPNKMHACGHDGHTAMLLGAAKILQKNRADLPMDVLLVFQPAEEGPNLGGARVMLEDFIATGLAKKIVNFFGLHLFNDFPIGTVALRYGAMASSTDEYEIKVVGSGGHAGQPDKSIDALSIGAKIVLSIESFMSRRINPYDAAICSTGIFQAGTAINIIAEMARIAGTIRCQRDETRDFIIENIQKIVKGICESADATYHLDVLRGLPVLVNDDEATTYVKYIVEKSIGKENTVLIKNPMMGAEDFAYFAKAIPSCFIWIGSGNEEKGYKYLAHHPKFDFDEDALEIGVRCLCNIAFNR